MFIALALWVAWLLRHWPSILLWLRGEEEWHLDIKEGQQFSEDFNIIKKVDITEEK